MFNLSRKSLLNEFSTQSDNKGQRGFGGQGVFGQQQRQQQQQQKSQSALPLPGKMVDPIIPTGKTVDERLKSMQQNPLYADQNDRRLFNHVTREYQRAYPGEAQYDEFGKMKRPQPSIQPGQVRAFDPNGTLGARPTPQHKPQKQVTGLGQDRGDFDRSYDAHDEDVDDIIANTKVPPGMRAYSDARHKKPDATQGGLDSGDQQSLPATRQRYERRQNRGKGDNHTWGFSDAIRMKGENYLGIDPAETHLRHYKDGWVSDKKDSIRQVAEKYNLPPEMLAGISWTELGGDPDIFDNWAHLAYQLPGTKPSNRVSAGDVSIQLRHVAEMEGLDPNNLTFGQERQLINRLQNEDYNLEMVARHLAKMRDNVFPEQREQPLTDDQIKRLGYMYNMGEHHPLLQPEKDLTEADKSGISNHGLDLMRKLERMRSLLK